MKGCRDLMDVQSAAEKFGVRFGIFIITVIAVETSERLLLAVWSPSIQNGYIRH